MTLADDASGGLFLLRPVPLLNVIGHFDVRGELRVRYGLVSLGTKVVRKWEGPTWDHEQASVVRLLTEQAIIEKLAYVMANPVQAGLVRHARDWPGITVLPQELGRRTWRIERPEAYFDADNPQWPDNIELSLTLPPALERTYGGGALRDAVPEVDEF